MSIAQQSLGPDLRVVYGLLASSALREIDEPANDSREVHLINLVRLLDMYRHGKLTSRTPHGVLQSKPIENSKFPRVDRGVADVERALDIARLAVRPTIDKDVFVAEFRNILLHMAEKEQPFTNPETVELVKTFVAKLAEELVRA
jgi:hypothetical protein